MNDERKDAWFIDRIKACLQAHMDGDTGIIGSVVALTGLGGRPAGGKLRRVVPDLAALINAAF